MNSAISPDSFEWKLLLAATAANFSDKGRTRLGSLINPLRDRTLDTESLLRCADFHGTSSLLYQNLRSVPGALSTALLESLHQRYTTNVQKSLFLARELGRILDCAHALGIGLVAYKGIVLSEIYYRDIAMRQAGDIDLFVRKREVVRMKGALRELGYVPSLHIPETSEADYLASGYEYSFDSAAGKHLLELQWALQPRYHAVDYDMDGLFARAVEVTAVDRHIKIPSPEDLLLILCVHAAKHVWGRLIWLCDIAQIVQRGNLDFDSALARAHELGIMRILHVTLLLANRFIEMPIPAKIESVITADNAAHAFAAEVTPSIVAGTSWEEHKMSYFRLMMRLRERRSDQIGFVTRLTFTPGPGEWQAMKLPRVLSPLYKAVRMVRLAARFANR